MGGAGAGWSGGGALQGPCAFLVADLGARNGTAQIQIFPPMPACGRWDRLQGPVDLSNLRKGSDWESGPAIVGKIQYSAGQESKTNTCGKDYPTGRVFSSLGFQGKREAFGYDQNYSPLAGQARLCFALAGLLYKGEVALRRDALPS